MILKSPIEEFKNIDIIPSDISLSVLAEYLSTQMGREKAVWRWFENNKENIEHYDYIFVDLSPSYDLIARNFMLISDSIITPIEYQGIASIRGCELFYQKFKQDLEFLDIKLNTKRAIVINSYTTRKLSTGDLFRGDDEIRAKTGHISSVCIDITGFHPLFFYFILIALTAVILPDFHSL